MFTKLKERVLGLKKTQIKIESYCSERARFELHYFVYLISVAPFKMFKPAHYFIYNASLQYLSF